MLLEAYSPLGSTQQVGATLGHPVIKSVAKQLNITAAQVVISWHVQRGVCYFFNTNSAILIAPYGQTVVLPKSVTPSRVEENLHGTSFLTHYMIYNSRRIHCVVTHLPAAAFDAIEAASVSHPPQRVVNPSKAWGLDFDIFDEEPTMYSY